jgi:hypothetical protein
MPARPRKPRQTDENVRAFDIVRMATRDEDEESAASAAPPPREKNAAAVALGALGASKGGKARAAKLSKRRRLEIAKKAATARWARRGFRDGPA